MKKTILIVGLAVVLMSALALTAVVSAQEEASLEKAIKLTLAVGEKTPLIPQLMRYFKLPGDTNKMYGKEIVFFDNDGNPEWEIVVRQRPGSSRMDIVIVEALKKGGVNFYLTSQSGTLERACYKIKGKPELPIPKQEAAVKFNEALKIWKEWERNYKPEGRPA